MRYTFLPYKRSTIFKAARDDEVLIQIADFGEFVDINNFETLLNAVVRTEDLLKFFRPTMIFKSLDFVPRCKDYACINLLDFVSVGYANILNPSVYQAIGIYVHRKIFLTGSEMTQYVITHNDTTYMLSEEELNQRVKVCIANKNLSYDSFCLNILNEIKM